MTEYPRLDLLRAFEAALTAKAYEEGAFEVLDAMQISADSHFGAGFFRVVLEILGTRVRTWDVWFDDMRSESKLQEAAKTTVMSDNLSLLGQMYWVRLHKVFPGAIRDVAVLYNVEKDMKLIRVEFQNGHVAEAPESEAKTDLFIARCTMLYDLPPR